MARVVIEIEDLPDGKVSYVPHGDSLSEMAALLLN